MKIAFDQWNNPNNDPSILPTGYPNHIYEIEDDQQARLESEGYIVMSPTDFETYKSGFDLTAYNAAMAPSAEDIIKETLRKIGDMLDAIEEKFETENILMGIAPPVTGEVVKYLHFLDHYLEVRASDEAIVEIDRLLSEGVPSELAPFVTVERLNAFKAKILEGLANL